MRLSVAMCTYNGEKFLGEQLASFAAQERLPDELVICDDGSTDATVQIAEAFAKEAPFLTRVYRNPANLGYTRNFIQAVEFCSGEVIALSDQDDLWYPQKLARLVEVFQSDPTVGGVFSNGHLMDDASNILNRTLWDSFRFGPDDQARLRSGGAVDVLLRRNVITGMAFAFRGSLKHLLTPVPDSWIHDGWLAFMIALRSGLVALPEPLVAYRVHDGQQVGAPVSSRSKLQWIRKHSLSAYLGQVHDRNLDEYNRTALLWDDLAAYLHREGLAEDGETRAKVEAKAAYAHRGARLLSMNRWRRWTVVLRHLEGYRRFSPTGLRAIPRDLLV